MTSEAPSGISAIVRSPSTDAKSPGETAIASSANPRIDAIDQTGRRAVETTPAGALPAGTSRPGRPAIARARSSSPAPADIEAIRNLVRNIKKVSNSLVPDPVSNKQKNAERRLRDLLNPSESKLLDPQQLLALEAAGDLNSRDVLPTLGMAAIFREGEDAARAARAYGTLASRTLLNSPPNGEEGQRALQQLNGLAAHRLLGEEPRELLDPPRIHAPILLAADTDASREAAMAQLTSTTQAYERIAHVKRTPRLPELIKRLGPELGLEDTPIEEIEKDIFDANKKLRLDRLEARFKISTTRSIFNTMNQNSWAGKLVPDVATSLRRALEIHRARMGDGLDQLRIPIAERPVTDAAATVLAMSSLAFARTFQPYLDDLSRENGETVSLHAGRLPLMQETSPSRLRPGARTQKLVTRDPKNQSIDGLNPLITFYAKADYLTEFAPHELAHAHESWQSVTSQIGGDESLAPLPSSFQDAVHEATADYIGALVSGMPSSRYERKFGVQNMMKAVIEQIQTARDVHTESVAIGLDVLLRAHFSGDSEACAEMVNSWHRVLATPEFQEFQESDANEWSKGLNTMMFVGLIAGVGAALWKVWGEPPPGLQGGA